MAQGSTCGSSLFTRSVRNTTVDTNGAMPALPGHLKDPSWYDFVLLASTVSAEPDAHYAGHRANTLLNCGSFNIGRGTSFMVRGLSPDCPNSTASAIATKVPVAAFNKDRNGTLFNRQLRAAYSELRILAHSPLRSHKNIVELLGIAWVRDTSALMSFEESNIAYWPVLLLEYSSLGSLSDAWETFAKDEKKLDSASKCSLCLDVARGLKALHDCDIVHGDLKCENILLFSHAGSYTAKLADFGHSVTELEDHDGLQANTPPWNAPEDNGDLNFIGLKAADIYGLGLVFWRIMTDGDHPFMDPTSGELLDDEMIHMLKHGTNLWEIAFNVVDSKMKQADLFGWLFLLKFIKGVFFSTLHISPLHRSLRHVITSLEQLSHM